MEKLGEEGSGVLSKECTLSRRVVPSSSPHRPLKVRPLMILVLWASANCPTLGLSHQSQYE
jgi:hypothetical protein